MMLLGHKTKPVLPRKIYYVIMSAPLLPMSNREVLEPLPPSCAYVIYANAPILKFKV